MDTANILVTGFQPFGRYAINSSWESVKVLSTMRSDLKTSELTVDQLTAHVEITSLLYEQHYDILLLSGLADYDEIHLETLANKPPELAEIAGPALLEGHWPWQDSLALLHAKNIPVLLSADAGKYVCESVYWSALNFRLMNGYPKYVGFFHVPVLSNKWTTNKIAHALSICLDDVLGFTQQD